MTEYGTVSENNFQYQMAPVENQNNCTIKWANINSISLLRKKHLFWIRSKDWLSSLLFIQFILFQQGRNAEFACMNLRNSKMDFYPLQFKKRRFLESECLSQKYSSSSFYKECRPLNADYLTVYLVLLSHLASRKGR